MKKGHSLSFFYQKRKAILKRVTEIPYNVFWLFKYFLIEKRVFYNKNYERLKKLEGIKSGKIGFLMGNGPSVKVEHLEKIANDPRFVTFAANRIHLAYSGTSYRPDFITSADQQVIDDFGQEIIDSNRENSVFFASFIEPKNISGSFFWIKLKNGRPFRFSYNVKRLVMSGGGSLNVALQIGYLMGIRKFYLYGVDHSFKFDKIKSKNGNDAKGDNNHFIKNYRSGKTWQAPRVRLIESTFVKMDSVLREENGFLINATNGGKLEVLERKTLDEVLRNQLKQYST